MYEGDGNWEIGDVREDGRRRKKSIEGGSENKNSRKEIKEILKRKRERGKVNYRDGQLTTLVNW